MKKYFQIIKNTWAEYMVYRLNFILWRVRWVIQRLVVYFLWWALFTNRDTMFGYTEERMLTYVLLGNIVAAFTLSTATMGIGEMVNRGDLSYLLLRPVNFFKFFLTRDIADKLLNFICAAVEITLLFIILKPPIFLQTNMFLVGYASLALVLGGLLYFYFSVLLGFLGFWSSDVWAPRFLSFVIMDFFAGGLFPLDILPNRLFAFTQALPFSYFIYFPIKVYLGQLPFGSVLVGLLIGCVWLALLQAFAHFAWQRGLRIYTAEGR